MPESPGQPDSNSPKGPAKSELGQIIEAKRIFLAARGLGLAQREDFITAQCHDNAPLRTLVFQLLAGDDAPLPYESLAEDIRAARDHLDATPTADPGAEPPTRGGYSPRSSFGEHAGDRLGNYRLLERIGEGGFGVVYLAQQEEPVKRRVALKILKLGMDTRQVVARFEAEKQALALMDHPGIARVYDAGATDKGRPYFVMELVKGVPITEYCDLHHLTIRDRLDLFAQVCDAIQHAHQKGVIHRDIKPSNVLVSTIGDSPSPKVIDFGIAKATSARLTEKTVFTEFRQMIGTPEYMSPEQAGTSGEDIDTRTDVYSLGVLLYELLAGATPFDAKRLRSAAYAEMQRIIREEDPVKPSTRLTKNTDSLGTIASQRAMSPEKLPRVLQGELDWIVMKTLEKDRTRRYDSAGSMGRDIQRYLRGDAIQAAPPSAAYRARKFVLRNKGIVLAASLVTLALAGGLIGTSLGFVNANRERAEAVKERTRADEKAHDAFREKNRADESASEAHIAEAIAQRSAYSANVISACAAIESNQFAAARAFLEAAPEHLRAWEWNVLRAQLDTSSRSLPCPMPEWKPGTGYEIYTLLPHPDGRSFFTTDRYQIIGVQRWDLTTGALLASFAHPRPGPDILKNLALHALSVDGKRLSFATGIYYNAPESDIFSWDLATNERTDYHFAPIENSQAVIALHPDGRRVLRRSIEDVWIEDGSTHRILARTRPKTLSGNWAAFSRDGSRVATFGAHGELEVFDTETLTSLAIFTGHRNIIHGHDFSPDNWRIVSASIDGTVQINEIPLTPLPPSASPPAPLIIEHPTNAENVRFSPDGRLVASLAGDRAIRVWDVSEEGVRRASTQTIGRQTADLLATFSSERLFPGPLMFTLDGASVAAREIDGTVRFWDLAADDAVKIRGHKGLLNGAKFAPKTGLIVSAGWDGWKGSTGCVRLWDAETGEAIAALGEPGEVAYRFDVSPDGTRAAASITMTNSPWSPKDRLFDQHLDLIDLTTGHVVRKDYGKIVEGVNFDVGVLAFDPPAKRLAIGGFESIDILRADTGELVRSRSFEGIGTTFNRVVYSPDGRFLVATISQRSLKTPPDLGLAFLLDAETLETIRNFDSDDGLGATFTPDSKFVCFGSYGGVIHIFDAAGGERVADFKAHTNVITSLAFNADASRLVSVCGNDGDVTLWDSTRFPTLQRVARFHSEDFVTTAYWARSDSGAERLVTSPGRTIRVFDTEPIRERVKARTQRAEALAQVQSKVADAFARFADPDKVAQAIGGDTSLSPLQRKVASQLLIQRVLTPTPK